MNEQQIVSRRDRPSSSEDGLSAKALRHPLVTGGLVLAGAGLAYVAVKTIRRGENPKAREVHVELSIAIDRSPEELYYFWRDFKNLPRFMNNLESVQQLDANRWQWIAKTINGSRIEWEAEIFNEKENELIAWHSIEGAEFVNAGSVRFQPGPAGHGTYLKVKMNYNPPAGKLGLALAQLWGETPEQLIKQDLRRLKQLIETGEIATIDGQVSGRSPSPAKKTLAARALTALSAG